MTRKKALPSFLTAAAALFLMLSCPTTAHATAFNDPSARGQAGGAGGDLVPVDTELSGGLISVGSTSQIVVLFRNDSGRPVATGAIQLYPSSTVSANVSLNQCSQEELPAGATCAISISVKGLQSGTWRVEMIMRHNGRSRLVRASMAGQVESGANADLFVSDIEAIPGELDYGNVSSSQPVINGVVLRNTTSQAIDINSIYIEAAERAGYNLKSDCTHLEPGQACIVVVTWSPVLKGQASGVLLVEHTGATRVASVNLNGNYEPASPTEAEVFPEAVPGKGLMVASQKSIDFGSDIETTSAITVSLVNVGDAPLTIKEIKLANSDNGLSLIKNGCTDGAILEPVEACPLTLAWSPVREGSILDDVQILHDGARGIMILPVRGTAAAVISQDSKAIKIGGAGVAATLAPSDMSRSGASELVIPRDDSVDPASVLDGFVVTSHSPKRSIIAGPGGSRIVFNGEEVVIGGFMWRVNIRTSGVEFQSGEEKVLLLFDRSLSSSNKTTSSSSRSSGSSSRASAPAEAPATE